MNDLLAGLNPKQREATEVLSGPLLILAGAGSGKTRVLTHRIAHLIANDVLPPEILAVTFTNKAAKEMQTRIEQMGAQKFEPAFKNLSNFSGRTPAIGTFHSICVRILRAEIEALKSGISKNFVIFDTDDALKLMKMIMKEKGIDEKEVKVKAVLSHISTAKNQLISVKEHFENIDWSHSNFARAVEILAPLYTQKMIEHNALDFDDLLKNTVEVFVKCPDILESYRKKWRHVLVDEYQDTNFAQYKLIRLLADEHQNLCVVGDDHQSIYSFRGADFRNILDFEKDFPTAKTVKLEQNYRSTANILANANHLIGKNETGREKNLWTENEPGEVVTVAEVFDEKDEGSFLVDKIREIREQTNASYSNFAVLYRMNAQSRALEESLMRNQIPYQIVGGTRFFDRKEVKDVVAYLRLIFNPRDDIAFLRIINTPTRKIGPATIEVLKKYSAHYTMSLFEILDALEEIPELSDSKKTGLRAFQKIILDLQNFAQENPVSLVLDRLIEKIEFLKFLDDGTVEGQNRMGNVKELFSVASRYDSAEDPLAAFLEGVALISDLDRMDNSDAITLMTVHASKGLEFPIVFLPGWETNMFPSSNAEMSFEALEEERRLAYVAITRAEKKCFISHAKQRMLYGQRDYSSPSRFIAELDPECHEKVSTAGTFGTSFSRGTSRGKNFSAKEYLHDSSAKSHDARFGVAGNETDYAIGNKVRHATFGDGTIIQISGDVLSVAFMGQGIKKIVASVAPIEKA